jgi:hypothetical protein
LIDEMKYIIFAILPFIALPFCESSVDTDTTQRDSLYKGITLVAPPKPVTDSAFIAIKDIGANFVALVPYAFTKSGEPVVHHGNHGQWWGETPTGVDSCISMAKRQGLQVMIKPQIWVSHGDWVGKLDYDQNKWSLWEKDYRDYIMSYVDIANKHKVEMICIGTELNISVKERKEFWTNLIRDIRAKYKGKLTYSANWDSYKDVPFWRELDFIGISGYFPLNNDKTPVVDDLIKEWKPVCKALKSFSTTHGRPILFTEYGYLAVDGCAGKTWELEKNMSSLPVNNQAQANAYDALWSSMHPESFWAGGFAWKWFPHISDRRRERQERDYTPQNKPAQDILCKWFKNI